MLKHTQSTENKAFTCGPLKLLNRHWISARFIWSTLLPKEKTPEGHKCLQRSNTFKCQMQNCATVIRTGHFPAEMSCFWQDEIHSMDIHLEDIKLCLFVLPFIALCKVVLAFVACKQVLLLISRERNVKQE